MAERGGLDGDAFGLGDMGGPAGDPAALGAGSMVPSGGRPVGSRGTSKSKSKGKGGKKGKGGGRVTPKAR